MYNEPQRRTVMYNVQWRLLLSSGGAYPLLKSKHHCTLYIMVRRCGSLYINKCKTPPTEFQPYLPKSPA